MKTMKLNGFDRFLMAVAPRWALSRVRARAAVETIARHYEAASIGRRTQHWPRSGADANAALAGAAGLLRAHARDLVRNNSWARRGLRTIANNTVGWGIVPKAIGAEGQAKRAAELWKAWAESTECDADGRLPFYGLQALAMRTIAESGEVLVRRRMRRASDGLSIPLQLQVLEPDLIDSSKDGMQGQEGGEVVQGVELDAIGRRVAYWMFDRHPGSNRIGAYASRRIPASEILHVYFVDRPGQVRGVSWFASGIVNLKDFDEYEDATLMRQKIAACFSGFVTDTDGAAIGEQDEDDEFVETLEPGLVARLPPGKSIEFANPPVPGDDGFTVRQLRRVAAGLGVTYEDLTGDYSQVNFSSARMARIAHWANVHAWRWEMLIPQFCAPAWGWAMEAAFQAGLVEVPPKSSWTPPPMPMLEPDKEGLAYSRLVRAGAMTPSEMVREQGRDPEEHWTEYAEDQKRLDDLGIVIDSDARKVTQSGQAQSNGGGSESMVGAGSDGGNG